MAGQAGAVVRKYMQEEVQPGTVRRIRAARPGFLVVVGQDTATVEYIIAGCFDNRHACSRAGIARGEGESVDGVALRLACGRVKLRASKSSLGTRAASEAARKTGLPPRGRRKPPPPPGRHGAVATQATNRANMALIPCSMSPLLTPSTGVVGHQQPHKRLAG